jgi:hypothetical protein
MDGFGVVGDNARTQALRGSIRSIGLTRIVGLVLPIHQQEGVMSKDRLRLSLGMLIVLVAVGLLADRSQAQPEQTRLAIPPLYVKIGEWRFNPGEVTSVETGEFVGDRKILVHLGPGQGKSFTFGTDGEAEALLEWFDAHSTELKPKPVEKK